AADRRHAVRRLVAHALDDGLAAVGEIQVQHLRRRSLGARGQRHDGRDHPRQRGSRRQRSPRHPTHPYKMTTPAALGWPGGRFQVNTLAARGEPVIVRRKMSERSAHGGGQPIAPGGNVPAGAAHGGSPGGGHGGAQGSAQGGGDDLWDRRLPLYAYLEPLWTGRKVLEIGCGTGVSAEYL